MMMMMESTAAQLQSTTILEYSTVSYSVVEELLTLLTLEYIEYRDSVRFG